LRSDKKHHHDQKHDTTPQEAREKEPTTNQENRIYNNLDHTIILSGRRQILHLSDEFGREQN
jgi:hypothetical protein